MAQPFVVVDAFTDKPFAGNPAAVCVMEGAADEAWMRNVAREMNLSETAFLHPEGDGYRLRWFTPAVEVELCGHATLASAHVLWESRRVAPTAPLRFYTRSGLLCAEREDALIVLDFPAIQLLPCEPPAGLKRIFPEMVAVHTSGAAPNPRLLIELPSEAAVRAPIEPRSLLEIGLKGAVVTAASSAQYDFVSRYFAPGYGVDEDPVTGSAHCSLGPFWARRLGKDDLLAYQASARGGSVRVSVRGERVLLGGHAVTVSRGEILW